MNFAHCLIQRQANIKFKYKSDSKFKCKQKMPKSISFANFPIEREEKSYQTLTGWMLAETKQLKRLIKKHIVNATKNVKCVDVHISRIQITIGKLRLL